MPDHLIDTHVFIWALSAPENLSEVARGIVEDPESATFVSAISAYEIVLASSARRPAGSTACLV
ncbi:PIN domain-containing protein [Stappia sp.]|uniref:PIN domain-containing protein n=1 Tax=Stappia sp. TaxID=1870903 RepID=UPI003D0DCC7C